MRKLSTIAIFFSLLLVSVASACTMPFLNYNAINLNGIYNTVEPYENNTGNCLLSTDETILFFNPVERRKIRSIMTGKIVNSQIPCLSSVASEKNWKIEQLDVKQQNSVLQFNNHQISESEMLRLKLTKDWEQMIENKRIVPADASIVRLMPNRFLITGGRSDKTSDALSQQDPGQLAFVYDSSLDKVLKKFYLKQHRYHHLSLLLPDGKVLLLDGNFMEDANPNAELVDPLLGNSVLFKMASKIPRTGATACIDESGNCILVGGTLRGPEFGTGVLPIERINIEQEKFERIGSLTSPRSFEFYNVSDIPVNVISLNKNKLLVSGGKTYTGVYGPAFRTDAEIVQVSKSN